VTMNRRQQMSTDEETLDDPTGELERLLDERAAANEDRKPGMRIFKAKHSLAKEKVEEIIKARELGPGEYRVGDHIITVRKNEPREISFERASSTVIGFKIAKP
jgi:hypothetical protein